MNLDELNSDVIYAYFSRWEYSLEKYKYLHSLKFSITLRMMCRLIQHPFLSRDLEIPIFLFILSKEAIDKFNTAFMIYSSHILLSI